MKQQTHDPFLHFSPAKLMCHMRQHLDRPAQAASDDQLSRTAHKPHTVPDTAIFKWLLDEEQKKQYMELGYSGLYALSFALRHSITQVAALFHLSALEDEQQLTMAFQLRGIFGIDMQEWLQESQKERKAWQQAGWGVPVWGFSPMGCYVVARNVSACRAFDPYESKLCMESAEEASPFCSRHQQHNWWDDQLSGAGVQATMFAFYAWRDHLFAYSEDDLRAEVKRFWERIGAYNRTLSPSVSTLQALELDSYEELKTMDSKQLRHHYLRLARSAHPDHGGNHQSFVALQQAYSDAQAYMYHQGQRKTKPPHT
ncbi:J domain-containing protein [Desulfurispira natronophila]|uniref:J domain-containing protein n=1 Tax=Desulfurispira natronophila TaxID=682562 RepID=A0A7W8DHW9_9BACT|nr:J domain-containing protein [Desulfurispira natronophila]MBB5022889.1 hypothetical protein [Desulfurispira natronophila]